MKKMLICVATVALFSFILTLSFADARGRGGSGATRSTTVKNEAIFHVSPQQFRKALKIFLKKYPSHECDEWEYNFNSQQYSNECSKGEENIILKLLMDGSILTEKISKDYSTITTKKIGLWE